MRDNSWIVGQPYLNLTGLRAGLPVIRKKTHLRIGDNPSNWITSE